MTSTTYYQEEFTAAERSILRHFFTNLDGPVFALTNMPQVVAGALFARYSRTHKSLRRLFLDEFAKDFDPESLTMTRAGLARAEQMYEKVFFEFGDDSVAQLGGVHLACEQASNILTKVLEWGRLMAYLEQSTRYIAYDVQQGGLYRYYRDAAVLDSPLGSSYTAVMDEAFMDYSWLLAELTQYVRETTPRQASDSDTAYQNATRAKALDAVRGLLPAGTTSNLGMYGDGQAYEALLLRMRVHPLQEVRDYSELMLHELRKVIPDFLRRVDEPSKGGMWSAYFATTRQATLDMAARLLDGIKPQPADEVTLTDWDPEGEVKLVAAILYSVSRHPEAQLIELAAKMPENERQVVISSYVGDRSHNRRHKPGRAFERTYYRFDVCSNYGAFRDLQRHRMLTIEWQPLGPYLGYQVPQLVVDAHLDSAYVAALDRSAQLYEFLAPIFPEQAQYAVALAYRLRYVMQFNARESIHMLELRTSPQAHPSYAEICQEMHRQIGEVAGHTAIAGTMVNMGGENAAAGRLAAEERAATKRAPRQT